MMQPQDKVIERPEGTIFVAATRFTVYAGGAVHHYTGVLDCVLDRPQGKPIGAVERQAGRPAWRAVHWPDGKSDHVLYSHHGTFDAALDVVIKEELAYRRMQRQLARAVGQRLRGGA